MAWKIIYRISYLLTIFGYIVFPNYSHALTNLLTNPGAESGSTTGWTVTANGGNGWAANTATPVRSGSYSFKTSYGFDVMEQTIDLLTAGYSANFLDTSPDIIFSAWLSTRFDQGGQYYLTFKLLESDGTTVVSSFNYGTSGSPISIGVGVDWFEKAHTFSSYETGVRKVYIQVAGRDLSGWAGHYGTHFDDISITVDDSDSTSPSVIYFNPADSSVDISLDQTFEIAFNEDIQVGSGNITLKKVSDNSTVETIDITSNKVTASSTTAFIINPSVTLNGSTEYYFTIDATAIEDLAGNSFAGISDSTTWSFTTLASGGKSRIIREPAKPQIQVSNNNDIIKVMGTNFTQGTYVTEVGFEYWTDERTKQTIIIDTNAHSYTYMLYGLPCNKYTFRNYTKSSNLITYSDEINIEIICKKEYINDESNKSGKNSSEEIVEMVDDENTSFESLANYKNIYLNPIIYLNADLFLGTESDDVKILQIFLITELIGLSAIELYQIGATGYFGNYTKNALSEYQRNYGIAPSQGYFGPITRKHISDTLLNIN